MPEMTLVPNTGIQDFILYAARNAILLILHALQIMIDVHTIKDLQIPYHSDVDSWQ